MTVSSGRRADIDRTDLAVSGRSPLSRFRAQALPLQRDFYCAAIDGACVRILTADVFHFRGKQCPANAAAGSACGEQYGLCADNAGIGTIR
ncbi:hypothetical protein [Rhodomicrobium lacus]|uniref:hypothetical protein n=1 Tax=Rhodomicrobium lacus TaxID=2498452 RepID=UPI0026E2F9BE|nr:hypothetical protein [Rhodomicrobium lacus]WKW50298.1 hypothetical protein QMO75_13570 [Rhodomicrobium lacus]